METPTPAQPSNSQPTPPRRFIRPRAAITETPDTFNISVEMPGVKTSGLEVTLENGELTLVGHRRTAAGSGDGHEVIYRESNDGDFRRTFELDQTIDATRISARIEQGLLSLTLPKAEAAKPRRIEISGLN